MPKLLQHDARHLRDLRVIARARALVCRRGAGQIAPIRQQGAEVERTRSVASLIRAPVCRHGAVEVAVLLQHDPEIGRGG